MGRQANLRVQVLGVLAVAVHGRAVPPQELASRKGLTLLKLLLARRGEVVPADVLVEALWAGRPPADPDANLATLVSRLRAVLGPEVIAGDRHGWRFVAGPRVEIDLEEATRLAGEADARLPAEPALALTAAERALGHADAATIAVPLDEAAWRAVMAAHTAAGEPAAALAAYGRLRQTLAEELGTDPAPESQVLHLGILRGDPVDNRERVPSGSATLPLRGAEPGPGSLWAEPGTRSVRGEAEAGSLQAEPGASVPGHRARRPDGARTPGPPSQVGGWGPRTPPASQTSAGGRGTTSAPGLASPAAAPADAGFVGRDGELADLGRAWEGAVGRQPRLVPVAGEAGIAKTRLVRALAELVPELRRLLDLPGYERAPAELERRRSFEVVAGFLRGLAAQQPLLLTLDDLHQAGAATLEPLHFVARRLAGDRVLMVATVRAEEGAEALAALADVGRVLELGPLPAAAVAELARRFGVADLAGPVLERARGHTLFTVESLRAAAEGGRVPAAVPASLRDAVQTRARRAGPEVEALLRAATVVGAAFDLEVVAGLLELPVDVCARRAGQAMAARLLVEDEAGAGYRFTNDLVREVLYRTSPRPTRVTRHRRLAAMLADRPEAAAGHAAAAGDWATAARAWMAAAAEAARAYANRDAERLLDQAVAAATEAGDPALEAAARLDRGQALVALGDYPAAFADQEQALRLATAHGLDRLEAAALEQLGWTAYYSRDHQAASELTPQARELAERAVAAPRAAPTALLLAARMRHAEGDLAGAREAFDAVLGEPDPATQTTGLTYLGLLLEHADQFAEARRVLDRSIEACRAAGLFRPLLTSCFAATLACANLGDLSGALDRLALLERSGGQLDRPFGYRWRVELRHAELTSRLDPPAAEGLLELARTYGSTKYQALALARLGRRPQALGWWPPPAPTT